MMRPLVAVLLGLAALPAAAQPMEKSTMNVPVDRAQATAVAQQALAAAAPRHQFVIIPDQTVERDFGWVFFYVPQKYLQTRDPKDLVPGNSPLVVYRATGLTEYLPSSLPPHAAIAELERKLAKPRN